ncbi:MAG: hypothetical protein V4558_06900 [Gemmatimonadota bacterium]
MRASCLIPGTFLLSSLIVTGGGAQSPARGNAAAQREDLAAFERDFLNVDRAFSPAARAEAKRRLASLTAQAGTLSDTRFGLSLAQIVALADNGHTLTINRGNGSGFRRVGIRLAPFGQDFYVLRATADHAELLGARLVAIDGTPIARLRDSARTLAGGIPAWRDRNAGAFLESPGQLYAMGLARGESRASYRLATRDGKTRDVGLALAPDLPSGGYRAAAILEPLDERNGWRALLTPAKAPWSLQQFDQTLRRRDAPELDAYLIQLRANVDGSESIADFLADSDSLRRAAHRRNIVLDMRMNGGGNLQLTQKWMSSIVSRLPADGRVVVLTSPWTFSAAISSTGYLKQSAPARVVLVGEAPGDRLNFFAEGQPMQLPHSGAMYLVATQRHDYITGCKRYTDCHGYVVRFPIAVKNLDPDVSAPWTLESYAAGRDPGMEAVARILGRAK